MRDLRKNPYTKKELEVCTCGHRANSHLATEGKCATMTHFNQNYREATWCPCEKFTALEPKPEGKEKS